MLTCDCSVAVAKAAWRGVFVCRAPPCSFRPVQLEDCKCDPHGAMCSVSEASGERRWPLANASVAAGVARAGCVRALADRARPIRKTHAKRIVQIQQHGAAWGA